MTQAWQYHDYRAQAAAPCRGTQLSTQSSSRSLRSATELTRTLNSSQIWSLRPSSESVSSGLQNLLCEVATVTVTVVVTRTTSDPGPRPRLARGPAGRAWHRLAMPSRAITGT